MEGEGLDEDEGGSLPVGNLSCNSAANKYWYVL